MELSITLKKFHQNIKTAKTRCIASRWRTFAMCAILFRYATHPVETGRERRKKVNLLIG